MIELSLDELEKRGINRYKAVIMASEDARFINDQVRLGILNTNEKPTTIAIKRLLEGRVVESKENEE
jgi:DNA-directed RNA polymerase subunit K/omega